MPYKSKYSIGEFMEQLKKGSLYKTWAKANPKEAADIDLHVQRKVDKLADFIPVDFVKTATGKAIVMALLSLPADKLDR